MLKPEQIVQQFVEAVFNCIFWNVVLIEILLRFISKSPGYDMPSFVHLGRHFDMIHCQLIPYYKHSLHSTRPEGQTALLQRAV